MTTKTTGRQPTLASLVLVKQKMGAKNDDRPDPNGLATQPTPVIRAHHDERIHYRQDGVPTTIEQPKPTTTDTNELPKASRQARQIEVKLLEKKMEEIDRKQESKKNEALDTWKGFDSLNYGFNPAVTPVPPTTTNQHSSSPLPPPKKPSTPPREPTPVRKVSAKKSPSPKRQTASVRQESGKKTQPLSPKEVQSRTRENTPVPITPQEKNISNKRTPSPPPHNEKPIEKSPSPPPRQNSIHKSPTPPPPAPRRSKITSAPSIDAIRSPEPEKPSSLPSQSPVPLIPPVIDKPQQPYEPLPPIPISNNPQMRLFSDIKHYQIPQSKNAAKSIQRSMDRYRFHVW